MSTNRFSLEGKVALITGATAGLGRALALIYRAAGAQIAVTGRNAAKNQDMAEQMGGDGLVLALEVRDEAMVEATVTAVVERFGKLDILVNNAGVVAVEHAWEATLDSWREVIDTNLSGAFLCAKYAAQAMIARGEGGKIVNIGSVIANLGPNDFASYAASKAGLLGLTRALAVELAPYNIQVNAILPGYFYTEMSSGVPDWLRGEIIRKTPAARWGQPEELAGAALLLASPASDYMTGSTVTVDGGYSIAERFRHE